MSLTRRDFLETLGLITVGLGLSPSVFAKKKPSSEYFVATLHDTALVLTDLISGKSQRFKLTANGHDVYQNPFNRDLLFVVPKAGNKISIFSLAAEKEIGVIPSSSDNHVFYGHIAFHPKKNIFYSSQVDVRTGDGQIYIVDGLTYKTKESFGDYPGRNHDLAFLSDNKSLVSAVSGVQNKTRRVAKSGIQVFDSETLKLIKTYIVDDDIQQASHLHILPNDEIITYCTPTPFNIGDRKQECGAVFSNLADDTRNNLSEWTVPIELKQKYVTELLNVAICNNNKTMAFTNPLAGRSFYFDVPTRRFQKTEAHKKMVSFSFKTGFNILIPMHISRSLRSHHPKGFL